MISTSFVYASDYLFDEYGIRKNIVKAMSVGEVVELGSKENVAIDKEWTVEFNQEVQLDKIFAMSIKKGDLYIPVKIDISGEKEAKITSVYNYQCNTEYSVDIALINGNQYKMDFVTVQQENLNVSDFEYIKKPNSNEMIILGYKGSDVNIEIPSNINGVPVTIIGSAAFEWLDIESVKIPNTITTIKNEAFYFNDLTTLDIPNSVITIGEKAFSFNSISTLSLPNSLETIQYSSFSYNKLKTVNIPDSVNYIDSYAFGGNNLNFVEIPVGCKYEEDSFEENVEIIQK
jgi:hypothetical protein